MKLLQSSVEMFPFSVFVQIFVKSFPTLLFIFSKFFTYLTFYVRLLLVLLDQKPGSFMKQEMKAKHLLSCFLHLVELLKFSLNSLMNLHQEAFVLAQFDLNVHSFSFFNNSYIPCSRFKFLPSMTMMNLLIHSVVSLII